MLGRTAPTQRPLPLACRGRALLYGSRAPRHTALRSSQPSIETASFTQRVFEQVDRLAYDGQEAGGAGGRTSFAALEAADRAWAAIRNMKVGCSDFQRTMQPRTAMRLPCRLVASGLCALLLTA